MLLDVIAFSFFIAFLRGGRVKSIPTFNGLAFLAICIVLQICSGFFPSIGGVFVSVAYLSLLLFFYFNREHEDIRIFMIGWFLNALVIWLNAGRMPVDIEQAKQLPYPIEPLLNGTDFKHTLLTDQTVFPFLADIMHMPFPIPRLISIGDLFIMLGTFLLVQRITNKPISLIRLREGKNYAEKY
ncbi:DUF5317 domain-containing protein [Brevibacillus borstelensis]|uniref:DUF5317 domain-containing protein n=1 Tax=Brevibacillus borstelensis TaxID=45462 RepID=UPI0030BD197D